MLSSKAKLSVSSAWVEKYTRVKIAAMYLYYGGSHARDNLALMGISNICLQL